MSTLTRSDAEERARRWVAAAAPGAEPVLFEFELGWVISARFPAAERHWVAGMVLDRRTGELVVGGTLPPPDIAAWYSRDFRPPPRPTPQVPEPRSFPATMSRLTIGDRYWVARSRRSDTGRPLHPAVSTFFQAIPAHYRERGGERSAEAAVFSEFFWAEETARVENGEPPPTPAEMRKLVRGARLETFRIREDGDPLSGTTVRPGLPVLLFLDYLGLPPGGE
ncbi:YwqJ-related putative deaminase [Actinoplanes utahensis]|uniref:YwqJ-related putative deaminase n=1 Tax=Actinoplanes utahensis TaxID=1869 RepID=UPI00068A4B93|nr:YwqJ-related putative deaminase [Actinoplanes utahensis]GIF32065.1 hypothetical protein Aut01nite_50510 [Actinoplanes utahensis]